MKKLIVVLLLLVYGLASTGTTIHLHYCCGKLDDISFSTVFEKECFKDLKGISKKRCCDNKHIELKLKTDQEPAAKWMQVQKTMSSPVVMFTSVVAEQQQQVLLNPMSTGPPGDVSAVPLFLRNCVFRI